MKWFLIKTGATFAVTGLTVHLLHDTLGTWRTIAIAAGLAILTRLYLDHIQDERQHNK